MASAVNNMSLSKVLQYNIRDTAEFDQKVEQLRTCVNDIPGLTLAEECGVFERGVHYLHANLPLCDTCVLLVPRSIRHVPHIQSVMALDEQWESNSGRRKLLPVFIDEAHKQQATDMPEHLRNAALCMDNPQFRTQLSVALTDGANQRLSVLYPALDAAAGLALNYFTGFTINIINDGFQEKYVQKCTDLDPDKKFNKCNKTVVLIPSSCVCPKLGDLDADFRNMIQLKLMKVEFEGLSRDFTLPMYKLTRGDQTYLVRMDCPFIISTLHKLSECDANNAATMQGFTRLSREQLALQRDRFVRESQALMQLKHKDKYIIVEWDDSDPNRQQSIKDAIIDAVVEDANIMQAEAAHEKPSAIVVWDSEEHNDDARQVAQFETALRKSGINVIQILSHAGQSDFDGLAEARTKKATHFLWVKDCKLTLQQEWDLGEILDRQDEIERLQIIPINVNGRVEDWQHKYLKGINHLNWADPGCKAAAINACSAEMPLGYPIGPVFLGLVWTATLNYLVPSLEKKMGIVRRIQKLYPGHDSDNVIVFDKLIVISEKHCRISGKSFGHYDGIKVVDSGAVVSEMANDMRRYITTVCAVTYGNNIYLTAFEYLRATACIGQFEHSMHVKISPQKVMEQNARFNEFFLEIQNRMKELERCTLLVFDDEAAENKDANGELMLAKLIGNCIEQDIHTRAHTHIHKQIPQ